MSRILPLSALFALLVLLGIAALPVVPQAQTVSAELHPGAPERGGTLLGENGAGLEAPPGKAAPTRTPTGEAQMTITVQKLDLKDVPVPTGDSQKELDDEGIMHLSGSGVPWQPGSNTFIVGHALGFMRTRVPYAFYDLNKMRPGDEIVIKDRSGKPYTFRVYDYMTVRPQDIWVTYPVEAGKTTVSLQTCTPVPTFENRLIVRAELVS